MGDVQHVVDYITQHFAGEGVECQAEGKGVLWVTPPPSFRDVNLFYNEISALDNVSAIDQETNGNQVRIKIMVADSSRSRVTSSPRVQRWLQTYLNSTFVLTVLTSVTVAVYGKSLVSKIEEWYFSD